MKLSNLNTEQLYSLRTKMILEKKSDKLIRKINEVIEKRDSEYSRYLVEDAATGGPAGSSSMSSVGIGGGGVAFANNTIGGMGPVVSPQPSSLAGTTIGTNWSSNGGTVGSGDVSNPMNRNPYQKTPFGRNHGSRTGKKSRQKKLDIKSLKNALSRKQDYTTTSSPTKKRVMDFNDFQKSSLNKVTKVKN